MVVYLDHNASAPLLPEARDAIIESLALTGNPSSVHGAGRALRKIVDDARDKVARLAGAEAKQVVFTGSGTEALTQAIVGGVRQFAVDQVVVGAGDHAAVLKAAELSGVPVCTVGLDANGMIDVGALSDIVLAATAAGEKLLVASQWVNNETGVVQPLERLQALIGSTPHILVIDAVQGFGKRGLDFAAGATDMVAISAHKIGGPAGVGALLVKSHADTVRLIPGGGQEQGRRGGTEATALIAGFGAACDAYSQRLDAEKVRSLVERLEARLIGMAPDCVVFGKNADRIGTTVYFAVPGMKNTVVMMSLDLAGVAVSSGSACSSGKVGASHVLSAMGIDPSLAECGVRISLGWNSTQDDVDIFLSQFENVLNRQRGRNGAAA